MPSNKKQMRVRKKRQYYSREVPHVLQAGVSLKTNGEIHRWKKENTNTTNQAENNDTS
jgi:hypothetical protein